MSQGDMARDIVELLVRRAKRFRRWPAIRYHGSGVDEQTLSWSDGRTGWKGRSPS